MRENIDMKSHRLLQSYWQLIAERDREKKVTEGEEEKVVERGDSIKCLSRKHRMIINKVTGYTEH